MAEPQKIHAKKLLAMLAQHRVSRTTRWLGLTADKGFFPKAILEEYEFLATLLGLIEYFCTRAESGDDEEKKERALRAVIKRKIEEEQLAIIKRLYVPKAEIGPALRNLSLQQRAALQRKLESELAPKLAGLTTLEIGAHMAGAVDEICAVFHDGVRAWLESDPAPAACQVKPLNSGKPKAPPRKL